MSSDPLCIKSNQIDKKKLSAKLNQKEKDGKDKYHYSSKLVPFCLLYLKLKFVEVL